jgi:hypothetical protein
MDTPQAKGSFRERDYLSTFQVSSQCQDSNESHGGGFQERDEGDVCIQTTGPLPWDRLSDFSSVLKKPLIQKEALAARVNIG